MRASYLVLAALLTIVPTAAFAQDAKSADPAAATAPMQVADPQQFTEMATVSNVFEIQSSQLALTKSSDQKVKDFAQHMVDDHTKAGEEMKAAAAAQGNVVVPPNLDAETQAKLDKLSAADGADFDKAYRDAQLEGHQKTVALFEGYSQSGPDGALKDFATKTLPTLQDHLKMISDMADDNMAAGAATTTDAAQPADGAVASGDATGTDAAATDAMAPAAADTAMATDAAAAPLSSILATGYATTDKDNLSSEIVGAPVYSGPAQDAENIGDINNLVIGDDGKVAAVIIGVGGFLGIGEKNVAVNYSELQWVTAEDKTQRYVLPTTKDALQAAPDFKTTDEAGK